MHTADCSGYVVPTLRIKVVRGLFAAFEKFWGHRTQYLHVLRKMIILRAPRTPLRSSAWKCNVALYKLNDLYWSAVIYTGWCSEQAISSGYLVSTYKTA